MIEELALKYGFPIVTGVGAFYGSLKLMEWRVEKVEKYSGELFTKVGTLERNEAAQEQINKNHSERYESIDKRLENIEALLRGK